MLAEAVQAGAEKLRGTPRGYLSPSIISECPMKTYKNWKAERTPPTPIELLRMNDGHYQEREMVDDLERAGFKVTSRNITVHIDGMVGHIDGLIWVDSNWCLLECKAMSLSRYTEFKQRGFSVEPGIKTQVQLYLASTELSKDGITAGFVYAKHKDTCRPYDLLFGLEQEYVAGLLNQVRSLKSGLVPEPKRNSRCPTCRFKLDCFGKLLIDFKGIDTASMPELVEKYKTGMNYRRYGKELVDAAREVFKEKLGDRQMVLIDDLKVQRIIMTKSQMSAGKFTEKYGSAALAGILEEVKIPQVRITEVEL